jgi:S-adenosylmethionine hydrolase
MSAPVIAWLSDFGLHDHYVGAMKGVALSVAPGATLVDITHDIAPQDVVGGAHELAAAFHVFPAGTIFVAVVDPGVGTGRRAIAARAGGYTFVAPDNGLIALALKDLGPRRVVELVQPRFARTVVSATFEGRDRFAPAAGWLARGADLDEFGPRLPAITELLLPQPRETLDQLCGEVVRVDRFGNVGTNISRATLDAWRAGRDVHISAGQVSLDGMVATYAQGTVGRPCALFDSSDYLELAGPWPRQSGHHHACPERSVALKQAAADASDGEARRDSIRRLPAC